MTPISSWISAVGGAAIFAALLRKSRGLIEYGHMSTLPEHLDRDRAVQPIVVLVAARNEENTIRECVDSVLAQDALNLRVVVANDHSTTGLRQPYASCKRIHGQRLAVVSVDSVADGMTGKNNAMHVAQGLTSEEWLCFTDADCKQVSTFFRSLSIDVEHLHGSCDPTHFHCHRDRAQLCAMPLFPTESGGGFRS